MQDPEIFVINIVRVKVIDDSEVLIYVLKGLCGNVYMVREHQDSDWRLRLNDTPNAIG